MYSYKRLRIMCFVLVAICGFASMGPLSSDNTSHVAIAWGMMTIPWLTILADTRQLHKLLLTRARRMMIWTFICCATLLFWNTDVFSDDAHRYRWDGLVAQHGLNPYAYAPSDTALNDLGHKVGNVIYPTDINNNTLKTIYPPGAQIVFQGITSIFGTHPISFKCGWVMLCLVLAGTTLALIWNTPQTGVYYLAILLSPIMLMHGFLDIHVDVLMALLAGAVLLPTCRSLLQRGAQSVGFAVAIMLKYLPFLLIPMFLIRETNRKHMLLQAAIIVGVVTLLSMPYLTPGMFDSLGVFAAKWQCNSLLAYLLEAFMGPANARLILLMMSVVMSYYCFIRYRANPAYATSLVITSLYVFSPVIHPWYLALPMILWIIVPSRTFIAWTSTIFLYGFTYALYKEHGEWVESTELLAFEYLFVFVAYWFDVTRGPWMPRTETPATVS